MKKTNQSTEMIQLSTKEMQIISGGKAMIKCELRSNQNGSYYRITYDDGSIEVAWLTNYA